MHVEHTCHLLCVCISTIYYGRTINYVLFCDKLKWFNSTRLFQFIQLLIYDIFTLRLFYYAHGERQATKNKMAVIYIFLIARVSSHHKCLTIKINYKSSTSFPLPLLSNAWNARNTILAWRTVFLHFDSEICQHFFPEN